MSAPHFAIIRHRANDEIARAVIVPADLDWADVEKRDWLHPYLGADWGLDTFIPVAFVPDEPSSPTAWPAGEEGEEEIRADIANSLERLVVVIRRGDLTRLDKILTCMEAMAKVFDSDMADDVFDLRNGMVPFKLGDEHYDAEADDAAGGQS